MFEPVADDQAQHLQAIMELNEHYKLDEKGNLEGLFTLDVKEGHFDHKDMWDRIDQIIYEYYKLHPIEMELIMKENREIASNQFRKWGESKKDGIELRLHMRLPISLLRSLETFCPELFEDRKNYHKFCERYKSLRAYE